MAAKRICKGLLALALLGLTSFNRTTSFLFTQSPPQNEAFKNELRYLQFRKKLTPQERNSIETALDKVETLLGVPKALLWCILFQESRFDPFKNATNDTPAKGLGQFTTSALDEVNYDTDRYDPRTSNALYSTLNPNSLPIDFILKFKPKIKKKGNRKTTLPEQPSNSYFYAPTAVFASGAYLNNRYRQIKAILDHQGISYDPQVLWLYAAAAYNKGARSILLILTHEYMSRGEGALKELLQNSNLTYALLTHYDRLDSPLKEIWPKEIRAKYIEELLRNMEAVSSCALSTKADL